MFKRINISVAIVFLALFTTACEKLEDTYSEYLEDVPVYSPKIRNLRTYTGLKEVSLAWDNPPGSLAKKIQIDYQDSVITTETLIDTITISGLEIKGYEISIYTLDAFGNNSVPTTAIVFPNGQGEESK